MTKPIEYQMYHFSQGNPQGPGQEDVPALLRRVAAAIEELGPTTVYDLVLHNHLDDDGDPWPSVTVYFDYEEPDEEEAADSGLPVPPPAPLPI